MTPQELRKLLELKRYERPPAGYEERFLEEFRERQRAELLTRSSISLFFERFNTYLGEVSGQKWAYLPGAAVAVAAVMLVASTVGEANLPAVPAVAQDSSMPLDPKFAASIQSSWELAKRTSDSLFHASFRSLQLGSPEGAPEALPGQHERRLLDDVRLIAPDLDGRPQD